MTLPWINRPPRLPERQAALLLVGLLAGALLFRGENFLERLFIDLRFFIAASLKVQDTESDQIALIMMDRASEDSLGVPQGTQWRQFHPALIEMLNEAGASVIVFDAEFVTVEKELDPALAREVAKAGNVLAGADTPAPEATAVTLRSAFKGIGDLHITPIGGKPRYIAIDASQGTTFPPLAFLAAQEHEKRARAGAEPALLLPRGSRFWINFSEKLAYFPSFSYADVLNAENGRIRKVNTPLSIFSKRIVFIGLDYPTSDRFSFPNALSTSHKSPGVYGQAFAADTLLRNRAVLRVSPWIDALAALCFLAALLLILSIKPRSARTSLLVALPIAAFIAAAILLAAQNVWIGYAPLFVSYWVVLILHWINLRISLSASLSRAVGFDPRLIEAFRRESARAGGPLRKEVTILIADVRGYTNFVSRTDPVVVSQVMAEYMEAMERRITGQGGYVNKYVGDEIVAVFGFPLGGDQSARRAVRAAVGMLEELRNLVAGWKEHGLASITHVGIGIDTGPVVFAEVGGRTKTQFDIIGDCINGASRIEHLTKEFRKDLLVSAEVYHVIEDDDSLAGLFVPLRTVTVRGQGERRIFGLL